MDIDLRTVYSIIELLGGIKKTYKDLTYKEKPQFKNYPRYMNSPKRRLPQRLPSKHEETLQRVRSFWI